MLLRLASTFLFMTAIVTQALAEPSCAGRPGALATSRVLRLNPSRYQKIGLAEYEETLPLEDREVVLTFDDGPIPPYTSMVLDALAAECVKATFFIVGEQAEAHPAIVQRAYREGHTIATHTEHHAHLDRLPLAAGKTEITSGIAAVSRVLGSKDAVAPFFRFPYLDATPATEATALRLGLTIWNTDAHASDWDRITPDQVVALALTRIERRKKGILLLHDIQQRTALALPKLLRGLKERGYRAVHVVPAEAGVRPGELTATQ